MDRKAKAARFVVVGGYLGAGKTTSMISFSRYLKVTGRKPAILVNDLGAKNLVDGRVTERSDAAPTLEITGDCICYQTENLVDRLRRFRDIDGADIIFSDIPGCGIGGMDHVYNKLKNEYPGEFVLAPFVAVADPEWLRMIMPEHKDISLPDEMRYLFDAQLKEAELILLNKTDLLDEKEKTRFVSWLKERYPEAEVLAMSAKTGDGVPEACEYLMSHESSVPVRDIGYGGPDFTAAEEKMSWYNRQLLLRSEEEMNVDQMVRELMEHIRRKLTKAGRNVPHLKILAMPAEEMEDPPFAKASLTGIDQPVSFDAEMRKGLKRVVLIMNARAVCESELLEELIEEALCETAGQYHAKKRTYFTECFGMMDEGRL